MAEVYQGEVGVRSWLQPPLAREAEAPGRVSGADGCQSLERHVPLAVTGRQHKLQRGLAARDATPDLEEVVMGLQFGRGGRGRS